MGAPKGNSNAMKNGSRSLYRLILGELPSKWLRVKRYARAYRRDLEAAVIARHGRVDVVAAHTIDAACNWVAHAGICRWLLNNKHDVMGAADIARCSSEIANAAERRNKLVKTLKIDPPTDAMTVESWYSGLLDDDNEADGPQTNAEPETAPEPSETACEVTP